MTKKNNEIGVYSDLDSEQQLLRYIMLVDSSIIPHVDENIFYGADERTIYSVFKELQTIFPIKTIKSVIIKQLGSELFEEIESTLETVLKAPKLETYKAAQIILADLQGLYLQRTIIEYAESAINFAQEELIDDAINSVHQILRSEAKQKIQMGDFVTDFEERMEAIKQNANKKGNDAIVIPTGIIAFDNIAGGIRKGEVGVVVGKTGGGKSVTKLNFAVHAYMQGFNVVHFGLEMSKHENQFRADSLIADIPATLFRLSSLSPKDFENWGKTIKQLRKTRKNYLEFVGAKSLTLSEILSVAEGIENKHKKPLDMLVIDHIVLVKGEGRHKDFHMQQWDTFERLTDYATLQNKAVWTSSQSTDEGVSRKKGMRVIDVKYSRAIAELAHILIALYQSDIDVASNDLNFAIRKGRGLKSGEEIILKPDFSKMILDTRSYSYHKLNQIKGKKKSGKKKKGGSGSL